MLKICGHGNKRMLGQTANTKHDASVDSGLVKIAKHKSLVAVILHCSKIEDRKHRR